MRRNRSDGENITERGQEMQDEHDLLNGLLESDSSLRKKAGKVPSSAVDPDQTFLDSNLRLFSEDKGDSTSPSADAQETPDPMQPAIDAVEAWLDARAAAARAKDPS